MSSRQLEGVECLGVEKRVTPSKHHVFVLLVSWSDGTRHPIYRKYSSFFDFLSLLKEQVSDSVQLPELPAYSKFIRGVFLRDAIMDKKKKIIEDFCQHILCLPAHLISSHAVVAFFDKWDSDISLGQGNPATDHPRWRSSGDHHSHRSPRLLRKAHKVLGITKNDNKETKKNLKMPHAVGDDVHEGISNGHRPLSRENDTSHEDKLQRDSDVPIYVDSSTLNSNHEGEKQSRTSDCPVYLDCAELSVSSKDELVVKNSGDTPVCVDSVPLKVNSSPPASRREGDDDSDSEMPRYAAISTFSSRKSNEVDLVEGATVHVLEKNISGWWFVSVEGSDTQGWAPGAFLEPASVTEEEDEDKDELIGHCKAVCDYTAQSSDEVSLKCGESVDVLSTSLDGWWRVRCCGEVGFSPVACLSELDFQQLEKGKFIREAIRNNSIYRKAPPPRRLSAVSKPVPQFDSSDSSSDDNVTLHQPAKSTVQYTQVVFDDDDKVVIEDDVSRLYAKVKKPEKQKRKLRRKDSPVLYAEIDQLSLVKKEGTVKSNGAPRDMSSKNTYVNCFPNNKYVNVILKDTDSVQGKDKLYQVTEAYDGTSSHVDGLCVKAGDVVKVEKHDGAMSYCVHCQKNKSSPAKGWVPQTILTEYNTDSPPATSSSDMPTEQSMCQDNSLLTTSTNQLRRSSCDPPLAPIALSPRLHQREVAIKEEATDTVHIVAKCGYNGDVPGTLAFGPGDSGLLLDINPLGWWLVNLKGLEGWVPGEYWNEMERPKAKVDKDKEPSKLEDVTSQPWYFGDICRLECESLLLQQNENTAYLVRESRNRVGDFTLSVAYENRVRHFPIRTTESGKFFIGNHHYGSLTEVVQYYQTHTLFHSESGSAVMLGQPVRKQKGA